MSARVRSQEDLADTGQPAGPPNRAFLAREAGALIEPLRLTLGTPGLLRTPRGDGRLAVLFPGWKAPEVSMAPIASFLRQRGHRTRGWGQGVNNDDVEETRDRMVDVIVDLADDEGRPVNLVGWSLGGVIAREVARNRPDAVHRLVTFGTPVLGGPSHTVGAASAGPEECARITELQEHLDETDPITVPITAIYTRNDGAVDWRACIDRSSLDVTMVEVQSTHSGLGIDPDVWRTVARALAA